MSINKDAIKPLISQILQEIGEDKDREGLLDTPDRVARMYSEIFSGYDQDPKEILGRTFSNDVGDSSGIVIVRDIPFYSHCEHHMVPFFGHVSVGYIPDGKVVGISKIARVVECFARRLQIQERLTEQIADSINDVISPVGVAVVITAEHMCMTMRGVQKPGTVTVTSVVRGVFKDEPEARAEFMSLIK